MRRPFTLWPEAHLQFRLEHPSQAHPRNTPLSTSSPRTLLPGGRKSCTSGLTPPLRSAQACPLQLHTARRPAHASPPARLSSPCGTRASSPGPLKPLHHLTRQGRRLTWVFLPLLAEELGRSPALVGWGGGFQGALLAPMSSFPFLPGALGTAFPTTRPFPTTRKGPETGEGGAWLCTFAFSSLSG